jgi:hypothetical protein
MSIFERASKDDLTSAKMGTDDVVVLDMDTECGFIASDELSDDESEDDLDDMSVYVM